MKATFALNEDELRSAIHWWLDSRGVRGDNLNTGPVLRLSKSVKNILIKAEYDIKPSKEK